MGANRETEHDMSHTDIAFLLAEAADEVEIGIAPYQSVLRGGRRRRARRWAVARHGAADQRLVGDPGGRGAAGRRRRPGRSARLPVAARDT
ncbi:hypothetical protein SGLAM104S_07066 [Streptomyces glaucescens]